MTRLRRAVTRPPPPRRAVRSPPSRPYVTGPRFETTIRLCRAIARTLSPPGLPSGHGGQFDTGLEPGEPVEEGEPVAEQARRQEVRPHVLLAAQRAGTRGLGVAESLEARSRTLLRRVHQPSRLAVADLDDDAAHPPGDGGPRLPERLADREPEPLANRLLEHDARVHLECVDLDRAH